MKEINSRGNGAEFTGTLFTNFALFLWTEDYFTLKFFQIILKYFTYNKK